MPNVEFPPLRDWYVLSGFTALIAALLLGAEKRFKRHRFRAEDSRKVVHLLTGILMLTSPFVFESPLPLLLVSLLFITVNAAAIKFEFFPSLLATARRSWGTVFYPLAFFLLIALYWQSDVLALLTGMSLLAIADVCAAFAGERAQSPVRLPLPGDAKSLQGTLAMFASSFVLIASAIFFFGPAQGFAPAWPVLLALATAIALLACAAEALSWRGSDNLSVALVSAGAMHFLAQASPSAAQQFLLGESLALCVAVVSYRLRFLDLGGALTAFLLGTLIFGLGGWAFSLPILFFFVSSSLLSRLGAGRKKGANENFQKGHRRDVGQVLANGGAAGFIVWIWHLAPQPVFYFLYLGAIAAVTADTWATEIGLLARRPPRLITSGRIVARGTSGAISGTGLAGALCGALCIAALGLAVQAGDPAYALHARGMLLITLAGAAASLCDSLLGATVQAQQMCAVCKRISEKKGMCCGVERRHHGGLRWMDNDLVNGLCGLSGAAIVWLGIKIV